MRRIATALATLLCFGCATVREPVPGGWASPPAAPPPRVVLAEPELELWMEGTKAIDPQESARALEASRAALSQAVAGRGLDGTAGEQLLVVRSRAIKVTDERRNAQVWSAVGIVFAVVAIIVIAVAASKSGSRSRGAGESVHGAVPAGGGAARLRPGYYGPRYYGPPPPIGVFVGFNVMIPPPGPWAPPPGLPPMEQRLGSRGWFDGDEVELTVEIVDAQSGAPSWRRVLREGVDPGDAGAMTALLDRALAGLPYGQRGAPAPVPAG